MTQWEIFAIHASFYTVMALYGLLIVAVIVTAILDCIHGITAKMWSPPDPPSPPPRTTT